MHGPPWLESVVVPSAMIAIGFAMLAVSVWRFNSRPDDKDRMYNIKLGIFGRKIIETSGRWLLFVMFMGLLAIGSHYLAEFSLHIYDVTPVDKFTHGFSGMAAAAFILIFNLSRGRRVYYPIAIGLSWIGFIAWELYEWVDVLTNPNSGIVIGHWDTALDLWIDSLGALAVCFIYDEFHKARPKKAVA
jgi:hypothetical protein